ncbi:hypothetical protein [Xanthomonas bonasiae]|uniref:hypothetical protein n=1 Tax=Xanthomonas bonasiae TaxID=2810351 RepID=UPI0030B8AEEA
MFSLSVLSFTVGLATKVIAAVAAGFLAKWMAANGTGEGVSSMALQQGGIGLVLSTLIITAPPMAASFFQGTLGQFTLYSGFGSLGKDPASGQPYTPQAPACDNSTADGHATTAHVNTRNTGGDSNNFNVANAGSRGIAATDKIYDLRGWEVENYFLFCAFFDLGGRCSIANAMPNWFTGR